MATLVSKTVIPFNVVIVGNIVSYDVEVEVAFEVIFVVNLDVSYSEANSVPVEYTVDFDVSVLNVVTVENTVLSKVLYVVVVA